MNKSPHIGIGILLIMMLFVGYQFFMRHPTAANAIHNDSGLQPEQREALSEIFNAAGISPRRVRLIQESPEIPCWDSAWSKTAKFLKVNKRFGPTGENCLSIYNGTVHSLSLVDTEFDESYALRRLPDLRMLQIKHSHLNNLDFIPEPCMLEIAVLSGNMLTAIDPLQGCFTLHELDISQNSLSSIPDIRSLVRLEKINTSANDITDASGLVVHPSLKEIDLSDNKLVSVEGIADIPWLEVLDITDNQVLTLEPLEGLPTLRTLLAGSNQLDSVETHVLARFPSLVNVDLAKTDLLTMPAGYRLSRRNKGSVEIDQGEGIKPHIEIADTPLAVSLQNEPAATQEARGITHVTSLPAARGRAHNARGQGREGGSVAKSVNYAGTITWLDGTFSHPFQVADAINVTVQASVNKGKLRVYLSNTRGSYQYIEATPGNPVELSGRLITHNTGFYTFFESVDGRAEGILWSVR